MLLQKIVFKMESNLRSENRKTKPKSPLSIAFIPQLELVTVL